MGISTSEEEAEEKGTYEPATRVKVLPPRAPPSEDSPAAKRLKPQAKPTAAAHVQPTSSPGPEPLFTQIPFGLVWTDRSNGQ